MQVGWVTLTRVITYSSFEQWQRDAALHCVPADSPYAFQEGKHAFFITLPCLSETYN